MPSSRQESNLQPCPYKGPALPVVLREHFTRRDIVCGIEPLYFFGREIVYLKHIHIDC